MENEALLTRLCLPLCPHWCPCLVSSRLSYPTGFTKLKRDWLFCSNFLCKPRPADRSLQVFRSGGLMSILLLIITPLAFLIRHWWRPRHAINTDENKPDVVFYALSSTVQDMAALETKRFPVLTITEIRFPVCHTIHIWMITETDNRSTTSGKKMSR